MSTVSTTPGAPGNSGPIIGANLITTNDLHKPEYDAQYHKRYRGFDFIKIMEVLGRKEAIRNDYIDHFEKPRTMRAFQVQTTAAGGSAGAAQTIAIHANSHNSNGDSFPMVGDVILFPSKVRAKVTAKVQTANANTITVTPLKSTDTIPAVTNLDYLFVFSSMHTTGSSAPESRTWDPFVVRSSLQIIRASHAIDNSATLSQAWTNFALNANSPLVKGGKFKAGNYKWLADEAHTYELFQVEKEMALMYNVASTNSLITTPGNNKRQYSTHGLIPSIEDGGINPAAYTTGAFGLANMETITTQLLAQGGARENMFFTGIALSQEINSAFTGLFDNGSIVYNTFGNGQQAKDRSISYGFSSFNLDDFTFHKKVYNAFSHPELFGNADYDYAGDGFIMPMDTVMEPKRGGNRIPSISIIYKGDGTYDRDLVTQIGGGMRNDQMMATTSDDVTEVHYLSECGIRTMGINRFVGIQRA